MNGGGRLHLLGDPLGQLGARGCGVSREHAVSAPGRVHLGEAVGQLFGLRGRHQRPVSPETPEGHVVVASARIPETASGFPSSEIMEEK